MTAVSLVLPALGVRAEGRIDSPAVALVGGLAVVLVGLYLASPLPALLALLASAGAISAEIESGAMQAVLARPVGRAQIVLGNLLGLGALLAAYTLALYGIVLLIAWAGVRATLPQPPAVLALLLLQPLILVAVTVLGGTFLPTLANGAAAILLYGLAAFGGALAQITALAGVPTLSDIGTVTSLLLPAEPMCRRAAALAAQGGAARGLVWQLAGPAGGAAAPSAPWSGTPSSILPPPSAAPSGSSRGATSERPARRKPAPRRHPVCRTSRNSVSGGGITAFPEGGCRDRRRGPIAQAMRTAESEVIPWENGRCTGAGPRSSAPPGWPGSSTTWTATRPRRCCP